MTMFKLAHAAMDHWANAAQSCVDQLGVLPEGVNLGFVYATDLLVEDLPAILAYLRKRTGVESWVGTVGYGICAGPAEYRDRPAVAVLVGSLPEGSFKVFRSLTAPSDSPAAECLEWMAAISTPFGIVHGDPNNPGTPLVIEALADRTMGYLVGGLTSSRSVFHQIAGRITGGGVSGVLFSSEVEVAIGLSQGCTPVGPVHVISDCLENIIIGLDDERAMDVFKRDVGELLAHDLSRALGHVHIALPVEGSDTGDYLVRTLAAMDPRRGWLGVGAHVRPGDRILFVRRDSASARRDLETMLRRLKGRLSGPPRGGVYVSCVARGAELFGAPGIEMSILRQELGELPIVGFYAGGEICNARFYGHTGVLTLFI